MMHNVEKHPTRKGVYIGYAGGRVYRVKREGSRWYAQNQDGTYAGAYLDNKRTLRAMSQALDDVAEMLATEQRVSALPNPFGG